ncbi:hypothetical protein CDD81_8037 [Ophiocordyceps australis]|uniref:mRNA-capping enzyme subunit beta n=1 Tax=Ophiocordyceps australis TaxID=1399860 RepID=A0A2C5Y378_9HYPO|nr:hypothetical protein CDD81_8037 [Ophiocordyceps australis]
MDLRSVLNTSDNGERAPRRGPPLPQQQQQQAPPPLSQQQQQQQRQQQQPPHQQQPPPSRPGQGAAQYGYREYGPGPHQPSPGKHMGPEYSHHGQHAAAFPPSPYQAPDQYSGRAAPQAPPPLQTGGSFHKGGSPSSMPLSAPAQSPYRPAMTPTPGSAASGGSGGYPFGPSQEQGSPGQRHQMAPGHFGPPGAGQGRRRDSFTQGAHGAGYVQQQHPVPQTPPVATPGGSGPSHPYLHQRSQSSHSTSTPSSAQSQHQLGPLHAIDYSRQRSQPPSMDVHAGMPSRQASASSGFAQPPSPYQRRTVSSSSAHQPVQQAQQQQSQSHPHAHAHAHSKQPPPPHGQQQQSPRQHLYLHQQLHHAQQSSPRQQVLLPPQQQGQQGAASPSHLHQPLIHRTPSAPSVRDSPITDSHIRPDSGQDRDPSLSVSPRTRVASLASDKSLVAASEADRSRPASAAQKMAIDADGTATPVKRKLDQSSMSPAEVEHKKLRHLSGETNGRSMARPSTSPSTMARKKRVRRSAPPIWAQSIHVLGNKVPSHLNFVVQKRAPQVHANGHKTERVSRHATPETITTTTTTTTAAAARPCQQQTPLPLANNAVCLSSQPAPEPGPQDLLGPWEASITGVKPYEEVSKAVADFIFIHVVQNCDSKEILSRGIHFEIEAKLGTLVDRQTNSRVYKQLASEAILQDTGYVVFRSSMTEAHHKSFNDFLNQCVIQTDPRAPGVGNRVQVHYKHRREIDRFFELPPELVNQLPGCMLSRLGSRSRNVRVRVTYDQKTHEVLNKIVKARVADIDLHMPLSPMDCRISINLEMNWDGPVEELEQAAPTGRQPDRNKDRLSYTHGHYQIDLTQVTQLLAGPGNSQRLEKEHELEIELAPDIVLDQGARAQSGAPHKYQELVEGLLDNVRVLARKANTFGE